MKIQEFSFGNYKSFKDIQTLNFAASKIKSKNKEIDNNNVIKGTNKEGISFLKSKAIYGANASGKSNIVDAFRVFIRVILNSVKDENTLYYINSFKLSTETETAPSFFQIIFWEKNIKYRYGFEADDGRIISEWLYGKPKERELPFFIRENQKIINLDKTNFSEGSKLISLFSDDSIEDNTIFRDNSLFLSTLASFGIGKLSKLIIDNLNSTIVVSGLGNHTLYEHAGDSLEDENKKKYILNFLKNGDTGIEDLQSIEVSGKDLPDNTPENFKNAFEKDEKQKLLLTVRKRFDEKNQLIEYLPFIFNSQESEGTKKLFELSPIIYDALNNGTPIIIDEFDARFHPLLTKKIVELFNSEENKGSQLVFITHDTNLLSSNLLRRDQIEFVEKDKYGASHLYSLVEFKGVKNTASFEKDYIQGKYGAIPFLGDFRQLINTEKNA